MNRKKEGRNFALIGAAGYIAPRHMKAILDTGNNLIAALDPSDSVGILDSFAHDIAFFTEFERFDRHAEKLRRQGEESQIHFVSICSPNYLHDSHIRFALRIGANAICEKPLVINPWNLDALSVIEEESEKSIYTVLQLRYHPAIMSLKDKVEKAPGQRKFDIDLAYITSRGRWYMSSWKGDIEKSGGVCSNIGIHFFDMLLWIFGPVQSYEVHFSSNRRVAGYLGLEKANVRWFLSLDRDDLPWGYLDAGKTVHRSLQINGEEFEFSDGFADLHTTVYEQMLSGNGFGIADARSSIDLVYNLRNASPHQGEAEKVHPLLAT